MKTLISILVFIICTSVQAQNKQTAATGFLNQLTIALGDYNLGSGFSFLLFEKKDSIYSNVTVTSSNVRTKQIIDSLIEKNKNRNLTLPAERDGTYALPIIQIMDNEAQDKLNWNNNTFYSLSEFGKRFKIPSKTILLQPLLIISWPPIVN